MPIRSNAFLHKLSRARMKEHCPLWVVSGHWEKRDGSEDTLRSRADLAPLILCRHQWKVGIPAMPYITQYCLYLARA